MKTAGVPPISRISVAQILAFTFTIVSYQFSGRASHFIEKKTALSASRKYRPLSSNCHESNMCQSEKGSKKTQNLPDMERGPSIVLDRLSKPDEEQRASLLMNLHSEPASSYLQAYFERLKKGSTMWDVDTYIEGLKQLANIVGRERTKYYDNPLKGVHFPDSFAEQWNKAHPKQSISVLDRDIRYQCPPSWSNELKDFCHVLSSKGEVPLTHALNEFLKGPTTCDCGIWQQFSKWMGIRYLIGDELFLATFKFEKGQFILTQRWEEPINKAGTVGNLLYPFYDEPILHMKASPLGSDSRIQTKSIFNNENYLVKHPGGTTSLQNVNQIDDDYIIFGPGEPQTILSRGELEKRLREAYNSTQSFADGERIWLYTTFPDYIHPHFTPTNWGTLAEEAKKHADHTLDEIEWENDRLDREKQGKSCHLIFNFHRLGKCLEEARNAYLYGSLDNLDVISRARQLRIEAILDFVNKEFPQRGSPPRA